MKIVMGVVLALVALLGVAPYFVGKNIESVAQAQLQKYQMAGYQYSLEVDRGYRFSVLTYGFSLDPEMLSSSYGMTQDQIDEMLQVFEQFELNIYVQHGPVLTQNGFGVGFADTYMRIDKEQFPNLAEYMALAGADYLFSASGRVGFSGSGTAEYDAPEMQYADPDTATIAFFSGLQGSAEFEEFGLYLKTSAHSEGASLVGEDEARVEISDISFSSEMRMDEESVWFGRGTGDFHLGSVLFSSADQDGGLQDLSINFALLNGDSTESTDIQYSVELAAFESDDLNLTEAEFSIAYENLSNQAINNYMELLVNLPGADEQALETAILQFALTELPQALLLNPAVAVPRFGFSHEGRSFEASFRALVDSQKLPNPVSLSRADLLLPAVVADLSVDADEELVNDFLMWQAANSVDANFSRNPDFELTPEMRQTMIDQQASMSLGIAESQGFVLRDSGRIRSNIHLADKVLDINGTVMPLPF